MCTTCGIAGPRKYLLDVFREKMEFTPLKRAVYSLRSQYNPHDILIEDRMSGQQLIQVLLEERVSGIERVMPTLNKEVRAMGQTPAMGNVVLEKGALWVDAFLLEAAHFPKGRHDDQVDSMTQALEWMRDRQIPSSNFLLYMEQETASRRMQKDINTLAKLKAPAGRTHVQLNGGPTVMVQDGIVSVPQNAVAPLLRDGFVRLTE